MKQPVGPCSQRCGRPAAVHCAAPAAHASWQGGMHTPVSHRSPAAHWPVVTNAVQPVASSRHSSVAPFAPQRLLPWAQVVAHWLHTPPWQKLFALHCCVGPHAGQLFASMMQVSTPAAPWQRVWPAVQLVPQVPHAPPLQKLPQVWPACHEVQPEAFATQVSTVLPAHR